MSRLCVYISNSSATVSSKMSTIRVTFKLQSIGYYPRSKSVYLTVTAEATESQNISILLDRSDSNLEKLGKIISDQNTKVTLVIDASSRKIIQDKAGRDIVRFRALEIEPECEHSKLNFLTPASN